MVNLFLVPSLRSIALNRISTQLCSRKQFLCTIEVNPTVNNELITNRMMKQWYSRNKSAIVDIIDKFLIPEILKYELVQVFEKIALQIHYWKSINEEKSVMYTFLLHHFDLVSWNPFGEIDDVRTAENVMNFNFKKPILPKVILYYIACYYAFEKIVNELNVRTMLHSDSIISLLLNEQIMFCSISQYWQYRYEREYSIPEFIHLFREAVLIKNLSAMKYFLNKLPLEGRGVLFGFFQLMAENTNLTYPCMKRHHSVDAFVFMLSNMTENEQDEIFRSYSCLILTIFLTSAQNISFPYILDLLFEFLSLRDVYHLLIQTAATYDEISFNYGNIFIEIFEKCSARRKKKIIQKIVKPNYRLLRYLTTSKKIRCIHFLLCFASTIERLKIQMIVWQIQHRLM